MTDGFFNNVIGGANCHGCNSDAPPTEETAGIQESTPTEAEAPTPLNPPPLASFPIDLTNFERWLELNPPVSTLAGMIDLIGSELYRRHWPTYGAECRLLASQLRTTVKYLAKEREPDDIDAYKRAREEERP